AAYGVDLREPLKPMVPDDDQAMVLPCTSVMVIIVLLNEALTCATPEAMFLRSRRRTRVASLPIHDPFAVVPGMSGAVGQLLRLAYDLFLPAIALAGPLRVRALVWVRWPRTGSPRRCRNPR